MQNVFCYHALYHSCLLFMLQPLSEPQCRYGVRAALNILEFLIDLLQKVQPVRGCMHIA